MSVKEDVPVGLECPRCGCAHFHVIKVEKRPRAIVRRRECRNCGWRTTTIERQQGSAGPKGA